jgi:dTDP-4-dehydrorhamnose reductase
MTKIFLTGSTSFLGTKFIELYGNAYDIFGFSRSDSNHPIDLMDFDAVTEAYQSFKPDVVIHIAADLGRDVTTASAITETNPAITKHLVELAKSAKTPFIFTSTEAVYGGKEETGEYKEKDSFKPRSPYGESKVLSEAVVKDSGLPYLITRGHRYVGISKNFNKPKQFSDTLKALLAGEEVHLDSKKLFKPVLINNICDIFDHYIKNDMSKQIIVNIGVDKPTTYYGFIYDLAQVLGINEYLVKSDGNEAGWPQNSTLSLEKIKELGYPTIDFEDMLEAIRKDN